MIVNEVNIYLQYLKLPLDFRYNLESDGLYLATYTYQSVTAVGKGKSKKLAKEQACQVLKPHLQLIVKNISEKMNSEALLQDLAKNIDKELKFVESIIDENNFEVRCIVGEHETCGSGVISEMAKTRSISSMIQKLSLSLNENDEKVSWLDMIEYVDKSFFKTLLYQICVKKSWNLSFDYSESYITREYHVSCQIKASDSSDSSIPPIEGIKYTSKSKIEGENCVAREICMEYFQDYNYNIYSLMKTQLEHRVQKFFCGEKVEYTTNQISEKPPIFKCYCKFSKLCTEAIHGKKKEAQGIAAWKMLQKLCKRDTSNSLPITNIIRKEPIKIPLCVIENTNNSESKAASIDPENIKNVFKNYHSYLKDINTGNYIFLKSKDGKYIFTFKYQFIIFESNTSFLRRSFGVGCTQEDAIQDGCFNLFTAISMKKSIVN